MVVAVDLPVIVSSITVLMSAPMSHELVVQKNVI